MSLVSQVSELSERGRLLRSLDDGFTRAELKPILDFADEHPATRQRCFDHLLGMLQGRPTLAFADERGFADEGDFADNERRRAVVEEITARLATRDRRMTTLVNVASGQVLGVVDGRDSAAVQAWLGHRSQPWRDRIQIVAIDPSAAFRKAITTTLPAARIAVDPFHLVQLANLA